MSIFNRLTPHHFARGWPIFWRMNLPFWLLAAHALLSISLAVQLTGGTQGMELLARHPGLASHPAAVTGALALALYAGFAPLAWGLRCLVHNWTESDFWQSQYSLAAGMVKSTRWITALLVVLAAFLILQGRGFITQAAALRLAITLSACILAGVLMVSVAFYGWLADQMGELPAEVSK